MRGRAALWSQVTRGWSRLDPLQRHVLKMAALGLALAFLFELVALYFAVTRMGRV